MSSSQNTRGQLAGQPRRTQDYGGKKPVPVRRISAYPATYRAWFTMWETSLSTRTLTNDAGRTSETQNALQQNLPGLTTHGVPTHSYRMMTLRPSGISIVVLRAAARQVG